MSGVIAPYDEDRYFQRMLKKLPDHCGWIHKEDTDDWFFVRKNISKGDKKYYSNCIVNIENTGTKNVFNKYGRSVKAVVDCHLDAPSGIIDPIKFFDSEELSWRDFIEPCFYCYNQGQQGMPRGYFKLKLKDKKYHTFYFNDDGFNSLELIIDGKLCVNGLMADKYMLEGPSKKFGTVMRNRLPYLCSADGTLLNLEKKKLYDEDVDIYYYVNSDKTFFYSKDPDDPKWY